MLLLKECVACIYFERQIIKMKVVFVSNYFNHHQKAFSDSMYELLEGEYCFVSTSTMREERKKLGYGMDYQPVYVRAMYLSEKEKEICQNIIDEADIVIFGAAPESLLKKRLSQRKIIFRYSERINKKSSNLLKYLWRLIKLRRYYSNNCYMLCAGAYVYSDYVSLGMYRERSYVWGYFPETKNYDIEALLKEKNKRKIMWCGRFLDWKHPEAAIELAKRLKKENYDFVIEMIGQGEMYDVIKNLIDENDLGEYVKLLGSMKPEQVRKNMESAGIYIFTSDAQEGWGAVLNEAMNSGCAVVASHAIGSVPYLIKYGGNGYIYENENLEDLYKKVKKLLDNPEEQDIFAKNAYETIVDLWNAKIAAERFLKLSEQVKYQGYCELYEAGVCSKAISMKDTWFENGE